MNDKTSLETRLLHLDRHNGAEHGAVFEGGVGALGEVGEHGVAGVAADGGG